MLPYDLSVEGGALTASLKLKRHVVMERRKDVVEVLYVATGTAPVWSVEARLEGGSAAALSGLTPADGGRVLYAHNVVDRNGRVAMGAAEPLRAGEVALLRLAGSGEALEAPRLAWARANATVAATGPRPPAPHVPAAAFLAPPAPNPAAGAVTVELGISGREAGADARVRVIDIAGRVVRTLHRGALAAGEHRLTWDLRDGDGRPAPAGLYFVQARVGAFAATRRLTVVH